MIVIELLFGILIAITVVVGVTKIAAPLAEAYTDRLKLKFQEIGPEQERQFRLRMEALEQQVRELQAQVTNLQDVANFNAAITKPVSGDRIKVSEPSAPAPFLRRS